MSGPAGSSDKNLLKFMTRHPEVEWADLPSSEGRIQQLGVRGAIAHNRATRGMPSPRRASSGMTSEIKRVEGRKGRQAHYTRKAILEAEKEARRRASWNARHPGSSNRGWNRKEAARKTRKAEERANRRSKKAKARY
jgi:hypothetical protein